MLQVIKPLPIVDLSANPAIFTLSLHLILIVLALIGAAIGKYLVAIAMTLIAFPIALVPLPVVIEHNTLAFSMTVHELAVVDSFLILFEFKLRRAVNLLHIDSI